MKRGLQSLVQIETWRVRREDIRAVFWGVRKGPAAVKQIDAICLDLIAKSLEEAGDYKPLRTWLLQEAKAWDRLRTETNDIAIRDALDAVKDCLDAEQIILQQAKKAA
ncbi:MAG TPA: hypothetical protein VLJ21_04975 [Candidatus Binatia bacterium]|nr:hypothetical protein [Candidatus Binatia bacterium]